MEIVLVQLYNFTEFFDTGVIKMGFDPYIQILHDFFWGIFFGFIGSAIYAQNQSKATIAGYLIIVGAFFAIVLPYAAAVIFGIILAFVMGIIFYNAVVKR